MSTFDRMKKAGHSLPEIWGTLASEKLNGRTIVECRYLTDEEVRDLIGIASALRLSWMTAVTCSRRRMMKATMPARCSRHGKICPPFR